MDPVAHTLAGATLAQTGLRKLTPLATATLMIAANLPDIDAVAMFLGNDASLYYRRGMTHGVIALALLPILLAAAMLTYDRFFRRRRNPDKVPVSFRGLLIISYVGVLSHPFLDWLNTYGIRLLMPFDGRWFYGDTLFIVDAWMWLLMAAAVVLAYSASMLGKIFWIIIGVALSSLVLLADIVPFAAKIVWCLGIVIIVGLRFRGLRPDENQKLAIFCVATFAAYLAILAFGNRRADLEVKSWLGHGSDNVVTDLMTGPLPANPFFRQVLAATDTHYYGYKVRVIGKSTIEPLFEAERIDEPNEVIRAALEKPEIRGFVNWVRFPSYEVRAAEGGYQVIIRDLRYARPDQEAEGAGIGIAQVFVEASQLH